MPIELSGELGHIHISEEVVATLAGSAAADCYGLVGMVSRKQIKDGIADLLRRDNLGRGVEIGYTEGNIHIHLYVVVSYGTRISEVAHNIQSKVRYVLNDVLGLEVGTVNIFVQGVRVSE